MVRSGTDRLHLRQMKQQMGLLQRAMGSGEDDCAWPTLGCRDKWRAGLESNQEESDGGASRVVYITWEGMLLHGWIGRGRVGRVG